MFVVRVDTILEPWMSPLLLSITATNLPFMSLPTRPLRLRAAKAEGLQPGFRAIRPKGKAR